MRRELLAENVEGAFNVFWPLMNDVKICIGLDQTAGAGSERS